MRTKNIIKKIIAYPLTIIENRVKKTNWYKSDIPNVDNYPRDSWYRIHPERNYDVVNLGSSSALFCFDYEGLPVKAFNWALKPQSMEYSFKILKQYFSILRHKGIVIIPLCPFSCLSVTGKWTERSYYKYFHILDPVFIDNFATISRARRHPLLSHPKQSIKRLIKDIPTSDMYSYNVQCSTEKEFEDNARTRINNWKREFNILDLNAPLSVENKEGRIERTKTLKDMVDFCIDKNISPVIVIPPAHKSLNAYFTSQFCENYIDSFIKGIDRNIPVLNYLNSSQFNGSDMFRDSFFMNKMGARVFTQQVLRDLRLV